jgi:hypothetical protein
LFPDLIVVPVYEVAAPQVPVLSQNNQRYTCPNHVDFAYIRYQAEEDDGQWQEVLLFFFFFCFFLDYCFLAYPILSGVQER